MLHALLIEDTIASVPHFLQPPLSAAHADAPFATTTAVRIKLTQLVKRALELGTELWRVLQAIGPRRISAHLPCIIAERAAGASSAVISPDLARPQARDHGAIKTFHQKLEPHQLEVMAKWRLRDGEGQVTGRDEASLRPLLSPGLG